MVKAIRECEYLPASVSNTAGTYVCNHVMYGMLFLSISKETSQQKGGFIHVPYLPEQVLDKPGKPYMCTDDLLRGLTRAIKVACSDIYC